MGLDLGASLGLSTSASSPDRSSGVVGVGTGATRPNSPLHREQTVRFEEEEVEGRGEHGGTGDEATKFDAPDGRRSGSASVEDSKVGVKDGNATTADE